MKESSLYEIHSYQYKGIELMNLPINCGQCGKLLLLPDQSFAMVLLPSPLTLRPLYYFSTDQASNIQLDQKDTLSGLNWPFTDLRSVRANCKHCQSRVGTKFEEVGSNSHPSLTSKILLQIDYLSKEETPVLYLVQAGQEQLSIHQKNHKSAPQMKLSDLLLSAIKPVSPDPIFNTRVDLVRAEDEDEEKGKETFPPIYPSIDQQRQAIEAYLVKKGKPSFNLNEQIKSAINRNESNGRSYDFSVQQADEEEQNQESKEYYFCQFAQGECDWYYKDGKIYQKHNNRYVLCQDIKLYPLEVVDHHQDQIINQLQTKYMAPKEKMTLRKEESLEEEQRKRLIDMIRQYNMLIDEEQAEEEALKEDKIRVIEDESQECLDWQLDQLQEQNFIQKAKQQIEYQEDCLTFYSQRIEEIRQHIGNLIKVHQEQVNQVIHKTVCNNQC